jgi:hypothetical protein
VWCNVWAEPPDEDYLCEPQYCIKAPKIKKTKWRKNKTSYYPRSPGYFNLNPEAFGLSYDIFEKQVYEKIVSKEPKTFTTGNWASQTTLSDWPDATTSVAESADYAPSNNQRRGMHMFDTRDVTPAICYDDCDGAYKIALSTGKSDRLCRKGSSFLGSYSICRTCISDNTEKSKKTVRDYVEPQFSQFVEYCDGKDTTSATTAASGPESQVTENPDVETTGQVEATSGGFIALPVTSEESEPETSSAKAKPRSTTDAAEPTTVQEEKTTKQAKPTSVQEEQTTEQPEPTSNNPEPSSVGDESTEIIEPASTDSEPSKTAAQATTDAAGATSDVSQPTTSVEAVEETSVPAETTERPEATETEAAAEETSTNGSENSEAGESTTLFVPTRSVVVTVTSSLGDSETDVVSTVTETGSRTAHTKGVETDSSESASETDGSAATATSGSEAASEATSGATSEAASEAATKTASETDAIETGASGTVTATTVKLTSSGKVDATETATETESGATATETTETDAAGAATASSTTKSRLETRTTTSGSDETAAPSNVEAAASRLTASFAAFIALLSMLVVLI